MGGLSVDQTPGHIAHNYGAVRFNWRASQTVLCRLVSSDFSIPCHKPHFSRPGLPILFQNSETNLDRRYQNIYVGVFRRYADDHIMYYTIREKYTVQRGNHTPYHDSKLKRYIDIQIRMFRSWWWLSSYKSEPYSSAESWPGNQVPMICWCWAWFDEHEYEYVGLLALRVVDSHAPTVIEVLRIATLDS